MDRTIVLCCTIVVLVLTLVLWIKKSRQAVRENNNRDAVTKRKRIFKFYGSAADLLVCYCILILCFDCPAAGVAAMVVSEMLLLWKAMTIS